MSYMSFRHKEYEQRESRSVVTRLIKSVAFWEMRYWAASMASITAKTLFCRDETQITRRLNLKAESHFTYVIVCIIML